MAFMSGKLKLEGNMGKAMALEKLMGKMQKRGFHSLANRTPLGDVTNYDGKERNNLKSRLWNEEKAISILLFNKFIDWFTCLFYY